MPDWKLQLYHRLPPFLRNVAASFRGLQLRRWRYGPETEELVAQTLERDHWSPEQWKTYQENRLAYILYRAATHVPYYRELWAERRRRGDRSSWEYLENWPILEKEPLRAQPEAFVAEDCDIRDMYGVHTSGTSGKPLNLWWGRDATRQWYAIFEARNRRWNGVSWHESWAIMGGQVVVPFEQKSPPYWIYNWPMNQMYLSTHHISSATARDYVQAINKYQPTHIIAYTSSAALLARFSLEQDLRLDDSIKAIITNAEPLTEWQRNVLHDAFKCRIVETYGQAEAIAAASEDPDGYLRFWPESGLLEVVDDNDLPVNVGVSGDFIATHLFNADMPLIRYRLGDRGVMSASIPETEHNRLPTLNRIEGRNNDMLIAKDGRQVFWINPIFYKLPILEAQIRQETLNHIRILYVPAPSFSDQTKHTIRDRLRQRVGDTLAEFERVAEIPREKNGKFRAVICNLSEEERNRVGKL